MTGRGEGLSGPSLLNLKGFDMKQKITAQEKREVLLLAGICIRNVDDYPAWVLHNIGTLSLLFATSLKTGSPLPTMEEFEAFCKAAHADCLTLVAEEGRGATRH